MSALAVEQVRDLDALLDVLADFADQQAAADNVANEGTMAVALAIEELYESRVWVDEWLEQKPAPKRPTSRWQADSRNRFAQWQAWKLGQRGRSAPQIVTVYRLIGAARIAHRIPNFASGKIGSEYTVRPWQWLVKNGYEDRIPEVWAIAVEMAGTSDRVTERHAKEALARWKHEKFTGKTAIRAGRNSALHSKRVRAELAFEDLLYMATKAENGREELQGYLDFVKAKLDERRR